jgi:hypothetical protein
VVSYTDQPALPSWDRDNLLYLTIQTALILERDLARMDRKVARIRAVITEVVDSELRDYDI